MKWYWILWLNENGIFYINILIRSFKNLICKHVRDNYQYLSIRIIKLKVPTYIGRYVQYYNENER